MPNVRIAQLGQTAVNMPFFEVFSNGRKYVFAANSRGTIEFKKPRFLQDLGVYSSVAKTYEQSVTSEITDTLKLNSLLETAFDYRFQSASYGSGLAFNPEFLPQSGWLTVAHSNSFTY